jgi:hypothetical protein
MSNLSDKEIDRLSREAADSYEPDATSLSWTRLEQKLVEQMPERPPDGFQFGRMNPYVWGPAVVLIAGISFYFIKTNIYSKLSTRTTEPVSQVNHVQKTDSNRSGATSIYTDSISTARHATASSTDHNVISGTPDAASAESGTTKDNSVESATSQSNVQGSDINTASPAANQAGNGTKSSANGRGSKIIVASAGITAGVVSSHDISSSSHGSSVSHATAENTSANGFEKLGSGSSSAGITAVSDAGSAAALNAGNGAAPHASSKYDLPLIISASTSPGMVKGNDSLLNRLATQRTPQKTMHINRSLSIGFTFGADYADAGGISNNQLSNNIGITLGYYLTNKLSINTGLIYSNKFYWAPGHDHDRPSYPANGSVNTYAWAPDIEYINGAFNMYELPLSLRYDFAKNDKTRFFVNAGASSYFILKQTNIYFSHGAGGRPYAWLSKDESPSNYWFGVGDLSFGLETDIGKGFSFQVEPFFRIPLQKMGVENLKMYSYGFMLSFRYAPVLSRTKR